MTPETLAETTVESLADLSALVKRLALALGYESTAEEAADVEAEVRASLARFRLAAEAGGLVEDPFGPEAA